MPELPEVEVTRLGISPYLINQTIDKIIVRHTKLRWPVPRQLAKNAAGQQIKAIQRRGKYLLIELMNQAAILVHLGMSGRLHVLKKPKAHGKHDHIDLILTNGIHLRYTDPRRFGAWLWIKNDAHSHPLLKHLGPEPLSKHFHSDYLYQCVQNGKRAVKSVLMDAQVVVGVGNIYVAESLFRARIHPQRLAATLTKAECVAIVKAIKAILKQAIAKGGTTLKDFLRADGKPGYFRSVIQVYGCENQPCPNCARLLNAVRIQGRSTVFCNDCQL